MNYPLIVRGLLTQVVLGLRASIKKIDTQTIHPSTATDRRKTDIILEVSNLSRRVPSKRYGYSLPTLVIISPISVIVSGHLSFSCAPSLSLEIKPAPPSPDKVSSTMLFRRSCHVAPVDLSFSPE